MPVDKDTVARIARLAHLKVPEEELETLAGELDKILQWVEQLDQVDTEGVPPMNSVAHMTMRWRTDRVDDGGHADKVLANAPETADGFFVVPKVVE